MTFKKSNICVGCWRQMHMPIPIRGVLSIPFKMAGITISRMHPNLCTICETMFTKVKGRKQIIIPATILFADLRNYTNFCSETSREVEMQSLLHEFYDDCASAVWERQGIINKFLGDGMLAIFNFPILQADHIQQAVLAAVELQRKYRRNRDVLMINSRNDHYPVGFGIGIHTGEASIGEVGNAYKDFTTIGAVVNLASRIQSASKAGEILVSEQVYTHVNPLFPNAECKPYTLKGIDDQINLYNLPYED